MNLVTVNVDSIRIGQPLPFSLRDESGILLAKKGYLVDSRAQLNEMVGRRSQLFIDLAESESQRRAYVGKLYDLVRNERPLGQIAEVGIAPADLDTARERDDRNEPDWLELQLQMNAMLRDSNPSSFRDRLDRLQNQLGQHARGNPDGTLFALIYLSSSELKMYSATHSMLVFVMCTLAASEVLKWPTTLQVKLGQAALTMNIGMTDLQDRLARQKEAPNPEQRRQINEHAANSVNILKRLGVSDDSWLEAVLDHHTKMPGPLDDRTEGQRLARLIQRADMFAARLSPRATRVPELPASAMQASYFDENRQIDEAGAALIKAVGIYSPGSFVQLATKEIAAVIKRGANTTTPRVAVLVNRDGLPIAETTVRDTSRRELRIIASVAYRDVKVKINLARLLALTK
jgi:HD-GYP domain-containing protein (c-di-GMP phosphodiesterase class II)